MLVAARTHDYGKQPVDHLAKLLKSEGIEAAQLVLPKAFSEINSYEEVTPQLVERIRRNFEEEKIKIQILGCYMDLGNPDDEVRKNAVDTFKKMSEIQSDPGSVHCWNRDGIPASEPGRKADLASIYDGQYCTSGGRSRTSGCGYGHRTGLLASAGGSGDNGRSV